MTTYILIIRTQDRKVYVAARGIRYTTWDSVSKHMHYCHPSQARRALGAFQRKFESYVGLRPIEAYMVASRDLAGFLAGRVKLPNMLS